jgi:hypothetical protein
MQTRSRFETSVRQGAWTLSSTKFTERQRVFSGGIVAFFHDSSENGTRCAEMGHRLLGGGKVLDSTTRDKAHIPNNLTLCHRETVAGRVLASSGQRGEGVSGHERSRAQAVGSIEWRWFSRSIQNISTGGRSVV